MESIFKNKNLRYLFVVLIVLNFLMLVYVSFFKNDALSLETLKAGGRDNIKLAKELYNSDVYKQQQAQAINQFLDSIKWADQQVPTNTATTPTDATTPIVAATFDVTAVANLKKWSYARGASNARFTILEFSEMFCPYCKRQSDDKVIDQVLSKYGSQVNAYFIHYIVHPGAEQFAQVAQCVGELGGANKFYEFIEKAFDITDKTAAGAVALAKDIGMKENKIQSCLDSAKYAEAVTTSTTQWRTLFGVNGTPGNVIIDNEKWTFVLVAGAYPVEKFVQEIDAMLK
jgi:protein-disulfide isomerase